jgi:ADP-ribose pyrophosphatase YjhB (NUDIX family)
VLVFNANAELLLCHASGSPWWDIPKGGGRRAESGRQAAVRETFEECGLRLAPDTLLPLGSFAYRRGKDLQLYATMTERFDPQSCVCTSRFTDRHGVLRPEMDNYRWAAFGEVPQWCGKSLAQLLLRTLSLERTLAQLLAMAQQGAQPQHVQGALQSGTQVPSDESTGD